MSRTAVIGTAFVDVKGFPAGAYDPRGRNVGDIEIVHGGVGRNVAENFANTETPAAFVGMLEDSSLGRDVERRLTERGVDVGYAVHVPENGIGMWLAIMDETGDLAGSISRMPDLSHLEEHVSREIEAIVAESEAIVLEMDLNERIAELVIREANRQRKPLYGIVGNMSVVLGRRDLVSQTSCFICNQVEAAKFFGDETVAAYSPTHMLDFLPSAAQAAAIASMVVTMGDKGAAFYDGQSGACGICPPVPTDVVDTTGAGDAFFSGTVMALVRGHALSEAVAYGARLASATIASNEATCPIDKGFFDAIR